MVITFNLREIERMPVDKAVLLLWFLAACSALPHPAWHVLSNPSASTWLNSS